LTPTPNSLGVSDPDKTSPLYWLFAIFLIPVVFIFAVDMANQVQM
jgi:hypothetical protein